jgi:hypothetical protein
MAMDNDSKEAATDKRMSQVAEILYRVFFDELRFAKQQQWMITNYTVLSIVGLFGVAKVTSAGASGKFFLCIILILLWLLGLFWLFDLQGYISGLRKRQGDMEQKFDEQDRLLAQGASDTHPVIDKIHKFIRSRGWLGWLERYELPIAVLALCAVVTVAAIVGGIAIVMA